MNTLNIQKTGTCCRVIGLQGDNHFISRIIAIGLTPGCEVEILRNMKRQPLLLFARDSMIALSRKESENVLIKAL